MSDPSLPDDDIRSKRYSKVAELTICQLIQMAWILTTQNVYGFFESFFAQFQWYRKRQGGKWSLKCHGKQIYWSPDNSKFDFVKVMAELGAIVDVIKTEDWS